MEAYHVVHYHLRNKLLFSEVRIQNVVDFFAVERGGVRRNYPQCSWVSKWRRPCLKFLSSSRLSGPEGPGNHPGRLNATTVSALLQPYNQQSSCSVTPLWKQKFDIGSTIYRRVVKPNLAALEIEKSASKAPFCKSF